MLTPYLRKADTTNMLLPYFRDTDTSLLNLTSRFAAKQNTLNGTGFVKASGTNITYDNSSYLRTGLADSTYLKLTGGTLTGQLNGTRINIGTTSSSANLNVDGLLGGVNGSLLYNSYFKARADGTQLGGGIYTLSGISVDNSVITSSGGGFVYNNRGIVINQITGGTYNTNLLIGTEGTYNVPNNNYSIYNSSAYPNYFNGSVGIGTTSPNFKLDVTGTLGVTGAATLSSTLAVTGDITEAGNNVLTNLDTVSLSNRINGKVALTGNETIAGDKTFSSRVNTPWLERTYTSSSATSLTVSVNTTWLNIHQDSTVTLTLPNAATYPGKELIIKQTGSGVVLSSSQNIIGFTTAFNGATQTAIINPISRRYATLVSDGNNWVIMQVSN
jgi:hypothetical protein